MGVEKSSPIFGVSYERTLLIKKKIHLYKSCLQVLLYLCRRIKSYRDEKSDDDVRGLSYMDGSRCR